jgi:hypothetical protein
MQPDRLSRNRAKEFIKYRKIFEKVKNVVIKVNPEIYPGFPFRLEEGKESDLGLFLKSGGLHHYVIFRLKRIFSAKYKNFRITLETLPAHRRSASELVIFRDSRGVVYRDLDFKGVGATLHSPSFIENFGFLDKNEAEKDYELSEKFIQAGIRTYRVAAIIELKEVTHKGKKITVDEAKELGIINQNFQPVIEIRCFGTKARILDILPQGGLPKEYREMLINDAIDLVSKELGRTISLEEYLSWFAETLGRNIGLMHKNGWVHLNLRILHNITLDCRIVDLATVEKVHNSGVLKEKDKLDGLHCLRELIRAVKPESYSDVSFRKTFENIFFEAYEKAYRGVN